MTSANFREAVTHLARSFRAGVPLRIALDNASERYGSLAWSAPDSQKELLKETILYSPGISDCSPPFTFGTARCGRFIRLVMDEIDRVPDAGMDESFVEYAAAFCQSRSSAHHDFSYVVFEVPTGTVAEPVRSLIIRVSTVFNELGHRVWEGGLFLYAQLVNVRSEVAKYFKGRRVLELGAGTGLTAAAYVEAGVQYALLTDVREDIVSNMEHNITMNTSTKENIETAVLDATGWADVSYVADCKDIDTIVAADMNYDEDLFVSITQTFERVLVGDRIGFWVVTDRSDTATNLMRSVNRESSLHLEPISCSALNKAFDYLVGWDFSRVRVYRVQKEEGTLK